MGRKWIQKAIKRPGALHRMLGIPQNQKIPRSLIQRIANAKVGSTIKIGGRTRRVTALLKRRAVLARTLGRLRKRKAS